MAVQTRVEVRYASHPHWRKIPPYISGSIGEKSLTVVLERYLIVSTADPDPIWRPLLLPIRGSIPIQLVAVSDPN
jgi:hypothetical protein